MPTATASAVIFARVYVVACRCGTVALNTHRSYEAACHTAQAHADLTGKCSPTIFADDVPAGLA